MPLEVQLSGANKPDINQLLPLVANLPAVRGKPGRPRSRPDKLYGDRAYDSEPHREGRRQLGVEPLLAAKGTEHGSGLGVFRWVVERTLGWAHQNRRLRVRYERRADIHQAFLTIACIKICASFLFNGFY